MRTATAKIKPDDRTCYSKVIGEKSSLRPVLDPIAVRYQADLYLPTGEISDTQTGRQLAEAIAEQITWVERLLFITEADQAADQ